MSRVDLHVLHMPGEINILGEIEHPDVIVHHLDGQADLFQARKAGFSVGDAEYVSFADPDDEIDMSYYDRYIDELDRDPHLGGVYSNSTIINYHRHNWEKPCYTDHVWSLQRHLDHTMPIHPAVVMRRDVVMSAFDDMERDKEKWQHPGLRSMQQILYAYIAVKRPWKFINVDGYRWHKKPGSVHTQSNVDGRLHEMHFLRNLVRLHK